MPAISDERLAIWASPPSQTEQDKADRAVRAVCDAIAASAKLSTRNVTAFAQGSYRNRTNVRADSDVDVCVRSTETYFFELPPGGDIADFAPAFTAATYSFTEFRGDVEAALRAHFGAAAVTSGSKAFDIHENTYRIAADAVPCFEYRWYGYAPPQIGTAFLSNGKRIENFPQQHYDNGVAKNTATGRRFKSVVRILKHLRYAMRDAGISSAKDMTSFLVESLVWNVPDARFGAITLREDLISVLSYLYANTQAADKCKGWFEVNGIKFLFHLSQPWTHTAANQFLLDAWTYAELK